MLDLGGFIYSNGIDYSLSCFHEGIIMSSKKPLAFQALIQYLDSTHTHTHTYIKQAIATAFSAIVPYERKPKHCKDITSAITHCTAKDMMPISTV